MRFRKKPVEVEAFEMTEERRTQTNISDWPDWLQEARAKRPSDVGSLFPSPGGTDELFIKTLEGVLTVSPGDWIIRGIQNEIYPCKPDIFEETYEAVDA